MQAAGQPATSSPASAVSKSERIDLQDVRVLLPELRAKRGKKAGDLASEIKPLFLYQSHPLANLVEGEDYRLEFYEGADVQAPLNADDQLITLSAPGDYRVVVVGTSERLQGRKVVPITVQKPKRRKWPWLVLALLIATAATALVLYTLSGDAPWFDPNAGEGLAGIKDEDIQAYLDEKVGEGMMNITVLSKLVFENGTTTDPDHPAELGFNNIPGNHVDQKLVITLDDTGEVIYESGAISPGQNIHYAILNRELDPGTYEATATVTGFNRDTHDEEGSLAAKILVLVQG